MHKCYTERESETEKAHDPCDTKADIGSLITQRNDCNEREWVRETQNCEGTERELSERERKKERPESELIKMSAELWKEKGERDEFHLARRDEVGWMVQGRRTWCIYVTCKAGAGLAALGGTDIRSMSLAVRMDDNASFHTNRPLCTHTLHQPWVGVAWCDMQGHCDQMEWWINQRDYG